MNVTHEPVGDRLVDERPLDNIGKSGAAVQQAMLDGERVITKRIRADDLLTRVTGGHDRLGLLWDAGVLDELPPGIDHAMIAVERAGDDWLVVQRDVSPWLVDTDQGISRGQHERLASRLAALHPWFVDLDTRVDVSCLTSPAESFSLLALDKLADDPDRGAGGLADAVHTGWEAIPDVFPSDVADALLAVAADARPLAAKLAEHQRSTFCHGDLFFANLAFPPDELVLLDWAQLLGWGPPILDAAMFLGYSGHLLAAGNDAFLESYVAEARAAGFEVDPAGVDLALLGALVQCGWNKALVAAHADSEAERRAELVALEWWLAAARRALDHL